MYTKIVELMQSHHNIYFIGFVFTFFLRKRYKNNSQSLYEVFHYTTNTFFDFYLPFSLTLNFICNPKEYLFHQNVVPSAICDLINTVF